MTWCTSLTCDGRTPDTACGKPSIGQTIRPATRRRLTESPARTSTSGDVLHVVHDSDVRCCAPPGPPAANPQSAKPLGQPRVIALPSRPRETARQRRAPRGARLPTCDGRTPGSARGKLSIGLTTRPTTRRHPTVSLAPNSTSKTCSTKQPTRGSLLAARGLEILAKQHAQPKPVPPPHPSAHSKSADPPQRGPPPRPGSTSAPARSRWHRRSSGYE